jgi:hypothetical protein
MSLFETKASHVANRENLFPGEMDGILRVCLPPGSFV